MSLSLRQLLTQLYAGQIRVPAFQRGFVWDMDRVAYFMDSLYKGYPFGSFLLWRTRNQLSHERNLGPFVLPPGQPEFPIDYVLDGQQRITSIFSVFQTELKPKVTDIEWLPVYFDLSADANAQDSQFVALPQEQHEPGRHFPLSTIFDSSAYRQASEGLGPDSVERIDELNTRFKELQLPVQYFETEERTQVAIVFERVNRLGMELDTLQLLTAWTWSEDFNLQQRFKDLRDALADYGFSDVGEDANLILRCAAAVIRRDASAESLISLNGSDVRTQFPQVENGIRGAVDFLRTQLHVETIGNLPYPALIVPLAVFFAEPEGKQVRYDAATYKRLVEWFWRSCFSGRYSGQTLRAIRADIEQMHKLKMGEPSALGDFPHAIGPRFFKDQTFRVSSASTKTLVLLLAQKEPLSFLSGARVNLAPVLQNYNRTEFHHMYPRRYLQDQGFAEAAINALANFCFLNRAENNAISGRAPSLYRSLMTGDVNEILAHAVATADLFDDDYLEFLNGRSLALTIEARRLMGDPLHDDLAEPEDRSSDS